jgi:hypothetical protein
LNENLLLDWTPSKADFYEPQSRLLPDPAIVTRSGILNTALPSRDANLPPAYPSGKQKHESLGDPFFFVF